MFQKVQSNMQFEITQDQSGERIDKWLSAQDDSWSRSLVQGWIKGGHVTVAGNMLTDSSYKLKSSDTISLEVPEMAPLELTPVIMDLDIVYEDEYVIVLNKPIGLPVHPGPGHRERTLVHGLLAHCGNTLSSMGGEERPGIVHRLDKDTSGLMVVAKDDCSHRFLSKQLENREMSRNYMAVVYGVPFPAAGTITGNIRRSRRDRKKMTIVQEGGREAITHYKVRKMFGDDALSLVECALETGRTHQIRVHLSAKGYPIVGDSDYDRQRFHSLPGLGDKAREAVQSFSRQALHAYALHFVHPKSKEHVEFQIALAEDIKQLIDACQHSS